MKTHCIINQLVFNTLNISSLPLTSTMASLIHSIKFVTLVSKFLCQESVPTSVVMEAMNKENSSPSWDIAWYRETIGFQLDTLITFFDLEIINEIIHRWIIVFVVPNYPFIHH